MEWLKNIALPQSAEHIQLLGYILVLVLLLFTSFSGIILWGTFLSVYFKRREKKYLDNKYRKIAKDIIELVLINRTNGLIFCIIPLLTVILIFLLVLF